MQPFVIDEPEDEGILHSRPTRENGTSSNRDEGPSQIATASRNDEHSNSRQDEEVGLPCSSGLSSKTPSQKTSTGSFRPKQFKATLDKLSPVPAVTTQQIKATSSRKGHSSILTGTPMKTALEEAETKKKEKALKKEETVKRAAKKLIGNPIAKFKQPKSKKPRIGLKKEEKKTSFFNEE